MNETTNVSLSLISNDISVFRPTYSVVLAETAPPDVTSRTQGTCLGLGAHDKGETACRIARAELAERYAMVTVPLTQLAHGPLLNHSERVDPRSLYPLSEEGTRSWGLLPFVPSRDYYWMQAKEKGSARPVEIIADLCCAHLPVGHTCRFAWVTSSGMAAHLELELARQSALFELYERDALMEAWMRRYEPPRVSDVRLPERARDSMQNIERLGYASVSLDLTCRRMPVVAAIVYRSTWPALVLTCAGRRTLRGALVAAWKEAEAEVLWRLREQQHEPNEKRLRPEDVVTVKDHASFYGHPANINVASFLWNNPTETARDLDEEAVDPFDLDTLYEIQYSSAFGFKVVRLLSPNLVPLLFGFNRFPTSHPARKTCLMGNGSRWPSPFIPPHPLA